MPHKQSQNNHDYKCCFCRYFKLEGVRWGHCEILNVTVKGNCPACAISESFFSLSDNQSDTQKQSNAKEVS
ncbi:MAG: hypothetical protein QNJ55_22400 [Xenococcus sp. MO_188.B8]|nr:hypothetical protein [Xenococcus sp. MO_188.B8]